MFCCVVGIRQGGALTAQESSGQTPPRALSSCFRPCSLLRPLRFQNLPLSGFTGRSVFGAFTALPVLCGAGFGWPPVRGRLAWPCLLFLPCVGSGSPPGLAPGAPCRCPKQGSRLGPVSAPWPSLAQVALALSRIVASLIVDFAGKVEVRYQKRGYQLPLRTRHPNDL